MNIIYSKSFGSWHKDSSIFKPLRIANRKYIYIGRGVYILDNARIEAITQYNSVKYNPQIIIHDGVTIQQNLHLTCAEKVEICENTAIAANVTITDIHHTYTNPDITIERQDIKVNPVCIGEDSKIYNNAVILPGVHIGKHVSIGANSVVTHDIPDYCVAAGLPAIIIKRYNFDTQQWEITDKQGNFIKQ